MDELLSAEQALAALRRVLAGVRTDDLHRWTPCPDFDVVELTRHLVGTVSLVGRAGGAEITPRSWPSVEVRVCEPASRVIDAWRRRGLHGDVDFGGRVMPARLALGVLSLELVVHGWDIAAAIARPLPISADHTRYVLGLARQIISPVSRPIVGFADPVQVADEANALDELVGFTGRCPRWPFCFVPNAPCPGCRPAGTRVHAARTRDLNVASRSTEQHV